MAAGNNRTIKINQMKAEIEKAKKVIISTGVFFLLNASGNMHGMTLNRDGSDSVQASSNSVSQQTKTTQPGSKSVQTKTISAQTKSKSVQKNTKSDSDTKNKNAGAVTIGTQVWAIANLNVSTFQNGDSIPEAKTNKEWLAAGESGKPAWCYYNNDPAIGLKYGKLYNWYAVNDPRGLAPAGWTLPGDGDWAMLIKNLKGPGTAGSKLKSTSRWNDDNNGTNETGFNGFPGGYRVENGAFLNLGSIGTWWSSTETNSRSAVDHYLAESTSLGSSTSPKQRGESVRCIIKR